MAAPLIHENIWFEKSKYEAAERQYYEKLSKDPQALAKFVEITSNSITNNNTNLPTVSKDDKRSKKEKKNKKEKKEKEAVKDVKLTNGNSAKHALSDSLVGGLTKPMGQNCGFLTGDKELLAAAVKGRDQICQKNIGYIDNRVAGSIPDYKNASSNSPMKQSLASEVAKARQHIKQSLECMDGIAAMAGSNVELVNRINSLEKENATLHKVVADLKNLVISLDGRVKSLEGGKSGPVPAPAKSAKKEEDDDDGVDLFGSDSEEESEEAAKIREARLAAYAEKKSKKPALVAKSNIILSVSPWDDETDMKKMEECVRTIEMDGLLWGASKLVPLAYGIHKLHISCVVEDDKVSVDLLQEKIQDFEDYVQSVDIAAFNKI